MKNKIFHFSLLAALLFASNLLATHNYSGEIIYRKTGPFTVEAQIVTFTNAASVNADRDTLTICWGDGVCEQVVRSNGNGDGVLIALGIKWNIYISTHTYAAEGIYTLYMTDPNRSAGILNINPPASDNIPFHLQAMVNLLPEAAGSTASPVLLASPVDIGVVGQPFLHAPNAYSADGDSIAYELIMPLQALDVAVPNYLFPNEIGDGTSTLSLNPLTGKLTWNSPEVPGLYVVAILVKFYQNDILVGTIMRDMLIEIEPFAGSQPMLALSVPEDVVHDVKVGDTVSVHVTANSVDAGQTIEISSTSGLYDFPQSPAVFTANVSGSSGSGEFFWVVNEAQIRQQPYTVVFKAKDSPSGLANIKLARFRVQGTVAAPLVADESLACSLFPNPTGGELIFEWSRPAAKGIDIHITDYLGRTLRIFEVPDSTTRLSADVSDFASGIYFVKIQSGGMLLKTIRFVKQ